jgi:UDP-glucose 4-epimerase
MIRNKTILVTGGAGFIGINLCEKLLENDNFVIIIDNFNDYYKGKESQFNEMIKNYENEKDYLLIKGDLVNKGIFNAIDHEVNYTFHLAAQAGVRYSIQNPFDVSQNNILSTINVFEYSLRESPKKVVYASSSSVYGNPKYTPLDEEHPKNPISPYAVSKLMGEFYADYYYRENQLPVTSLRFYTVYGPRGRPDMAIRKFFTSMLMEDEIFIYGDGTQLRDYTYITDIVNGMILAAESSKSSGEVFNLGCSNPINVLDLVDKMYNLSGKKRRIKHVEKQKGDVDITYSDITKAKKILGYEPVVHIDEGLKKAYEWQINLK